jgi:formiminotetrahydrofolate cyclodeaminase
MSLGELRVAELLAALGERTPAPASGAATALTGALAAALVELAGRFAGDDESVVHAKALVTRLSQLADEDSEAYTAFLAERTDATRARIVAVPEAIAACADQVVSLAEHVRGQLRSSVAGDAEAAAELGRAAAMVARGLAELNRGMSGPDSARKL